MQIPSPDFASDRLFPLGDYHIAALGETAETRGLAPPFQATQDALLATVRNREGADRALTGPRVAVRFSEYAVEVVLRSVANAAHETDNNQTTGAAFKAVFPDGLDAETSPRGAAQLKAARDVRTRIAKQPAAAPFRDAMLARLDAAIADFDTKLQNRGTAGRALGEAQAAEAGARETWVRHYDANAGAIRNLFPRQRNRQDLYFDEIAGRGAREPSEPVEGAGTPGATPGAA